MHSTHEMGGSSSLIDTLAEAEATKRTTRRAATRSFILIQKGMTFSALHRLETMEDFNRRRAVFDVRAIPCKGVLIEYGSDSIESEEEG